MADTTKEKEVKLDVDSERSMESGVEGGNQRGVDSQIPEKKSITKISDGSEYESAEEEDKNKVPDKNDEELAAKDQESLSELVDEEGGEEGIADTEEVDGDFLNGDPPNEDSEEEEIIEKGELIEKEEIIEERQVVDECSEEEYVESERHIVDEGSEGEYIEEDRQAEDEGSEEGEYVEEERQQGDGEECSPTNAVLEKELDFDEDRRNPQYIPKKGIFYEHDDRNNEDIKEKEEEPARDRKKKLWLDEGRWGHDRFRLEEQYPKSRHELIETYGYDIRNEDGPPRARRRRRYGRGPTKYERNWEDVTAYGREKFRGSQRGFTRGRRANGHFRAAPRFRGRGRKQYIPEAPNNKEYINENANENEVVAEKETEAEPLGIIPVINNNEFPALPTKESIPEPEITLEKRPFFQKSASEAPENTSVRTLTFENSNLSGRNSLERDVPPPRGKPVVYGRQHERGSRRPITRGTRGSGRGDPSRRGRGSGMRHISPRFLENRISNLNSEFEQLNIEDNVDVCNGLHGDKVRQIDNGAGDSSSRPKRYSSLRQRSLPETTTYQATQQTVPSQPSPYYEGGYQPTLYAPTNTGVPTPSTQSQSATSPPLMNPSGFHPYDCGIRLQILPRAIFPQPTMSAGQSVLAPPPPSSCIPPPNPPSLMDFAPPPPPSGYHQFAYQQYAQQPPPPPPTAPNEIYQPGITYYFAQQTQSTSARPTVQKRPKAAIPILPPPERENRKSEKEIIQHSSNNNRNSSSEDVNSEVASLRTEASQSQQLPSVGVES